MEAKVPETGEAIARRWLPAVVEGLAKYADVEQQMNILGLCGQACGKHDLEELSRIKQQARDETELLDLINDRVPWCGTWVREFDHIRSVCSSCGCPLVREYGLELSPTFCLCSRGWVRATFSQAFDREVEVDLVKAIGRGDDCCEFVVRLGAGK